MRKLLLPFVAKEKLITFDPKFFELKCTLALLPTSTIKLAVILFSFIGGKLKGAFKSFSLTFRCYQVANCRMRTYSVNLKHFGHNPDAIMRHMDNLYNHCDILFIANKHSLSLCKLFTQQLFCLFNINNYCLVVRILNINNVHLNLQSIFKPLQFVFVAAISLALISCKFLFNMNHSAVNLCSFNYSSKHK